MLVQARQYGHLAHCLVILHQILTCQFSAAVLIPGKLNLLERAPLSDRNIADTDQFQAGQERDHRICSCMLSFQKFTEGKLSFFPAEIPDNADFVRKPDRLPLNRTETAADRVYLFLLSEEYCAEGFHQPFSGYTLK